MAWNVQGAKPALPYKSDLCEIGPRLDRLAAGSPAWTTTACRAACTTIACRAAWITTVCAGAWSLQVGQRCPCSLPCLRADLNPRLVRSSMRQGVRVANPFVARITLLHRSNVPLQQRRGISTGLASSVSSSTTATLTRSWKATQTRTLRKARHTCCLLYTSPSPRD